MRRMTLARQYLLIQMGIVVVVLIAVAAISVEQTAGITQSREGRQALGSAESLAKQGIVQSSLAEALTHDVTLATAAETARQVTGSDFVAILGLDGTVLVSSSPPLVSEQLSGVEGIDLKRAWTGVVDLDGDSLALAVVPVQDRDSGSVLGAAVIGRELPSTAELLAQAVPNLLTYLGIASGLGLAGSLLLARRVKRQTLGMEPTEIAALVEHREALLHGVREGVIALDPRGQITVVNDSAAHLLGLSADNAGTSIQNLGLDPYLVDILTGAQSAPDQLALSGERVLALNRMPMVLRGNVIGTVTTMRDRSDLESLEEALGISKATSDTLRAQTHEFANQLHVIRGLLRSEKIADAERFIDGVRLSKGRFNDLVDVGTLNPALGALLIAKASLAAEQRIDLTVDEDSELWDLDDELGRDVVTIVGNLVDNAIDAVAHSPTKSVNVAVFDEVDTIVIRVADSGPGVPTEDVDAIFRQGHTTKRTTHGRGFGLALVRLACRRHGGDVTVENRAGAIFTAHLKRTSI